MPVPSSSASSCWSLQPSARAHAAIMYMYLSIGFAGMLNTSPTPAAHVTGRLRFDYRALADAILRPLSGFHTSLTVGSI